MILDRILADRRKCVALNREYVGIGDFERMIEAGEYERFSFGGALSGEGVGFIGEVKRASPSKGVICGEFDPVEIACAYEEAGVDAISVLTEPKYFLGDHKYLSAIKKVVRKPLLKKDFIFDEWQVYEAAAVGADAMLLIVAMLDKVTLKKLYERARVLGMDVLVETHDEREIEIALEVGADMIGINNRNLNTFEVDLKTTWRLRDLVPKGKLLVGESGIHKREDVAFMERTGVDALLIGESFMRASDKVKKMKELRGIL